MDRATTARRQLPWLLSRALFVLGGVVAGTATAWLISTASASADSLPPTPAAPVTVLGSGVSDPVSGVSGVSGLMSSVEHTTASVANPTTATRVVGAVSRPVTAALPTSAVPATSGLSAVAGRLRAAFGQLGAPASPGAPGTTPVRVLAPVQTLPVAPLRAPARLSTLVSRPPLVTRFVFAPTHRSTDRPLTSRPVRLGGGSPVTPTVPGGQQCLLVLAPVGSGAGSGGPQGPGGPAFGAYAGQPGTPGLLLLGALAPGQAGVASTAGKQPGVTPD